MTKLQEPTVESRIRQLQAALHDRARSRGHAVLAASSHDWQRFTIHGEHVDWLLYKHGPQRNVPLTKQELRLSTSRAKRPWKQVLVPSGCLTVRAKADFCCEARIFETHRRPLNAEDLLQRFERMAASVALTRQKSREKKHEAERRTMERQRSRRAEDTRWDAMHEIIQATEDAQRIRSFVAALSASDPLRPDQARRIRKFSRWAHAQADMIDPMSKGIDPVLPRLGLPK